MSKKKISLACPLPAKEGASVFLAHGGGGTHAHRLLEDLILPTLVLPGSKVPHDSAVLTLGTERFAFTTDSYVVHPLFFPGGDIATLAINGTVNDLAMCGASPLFLSVGMIIEEGFSVTTLRKILKSLRQAADHAGVRIVTGDTKVVDKGHGDGIYLNTSGIGSIRSGTDLCPERIEPGDAVLVSNDIGRHGLVVMAERESLNFESTIESDCAPLHGIVHELMEASLDLHCLRDLTRGGLASVLVELARARSVHIHLDASNIPIHKQVAGCKRVVRTRSALYGERGLHGCTAS